MKVYRPFKRVLPPLDVLRFPAAFEHRIETLCLNCSSILTLHQPDKESPDRLIGICESCKHWFLIDMIPDEIEGVMVRLPDLQVIRELSREDPAEGISLMSHEPGRPPGPIAGSSPGP